MSSPIKDLTRDWPLVGNPALRRRAKGARRRVAESAGSDRFSRLGSHDLDRLLWAELGHRDGTFVEAGAHDGVTYSNTYWLERFQGWSGVLVEPVAEQVRRARRSRPHSHVVHAALVAPEQAGMPVQLTALDLASTVAGAFGDPAAEADHLAHGARTQPVAPRPETAPGRTLSDILDELSVGEVDLLSLDVEGFEVPALRGLDLDRHGPRVLLVEVLREADLEPILDVLGDRYADAGRVTPQDHLLRRR